MSYVRRTVHGLTIDSPTTRDIDDAIWVERVDDPWTVSLSGWRVFVSIADVAAGVPIGSPEDEHAKSLVVSRYLPARIIPMLPKQLSEHDLSLWAHKRRKTITVEVLVDAALDIRDVQVYPSELTSFAKLSYSDVPKILANSTNKHHKVIKLLSELAPKLLLKRRRSGALALYDLSHGWLSTEEGWLRKIERREDTMGYIIIQELMVLANTELAKFISAANVPILYRNHETTFSSPDREFLMSLISSASSEPVTAIDDTQKETYLSLQKAHYAAENKGHFGLNLPVYTHLTSPIRRYADLINQRQLLAHCLGQPLPYSTLDLEGLATHINEVQETLRTEKTSKAKDRANATAIRDLQSADTLIALSASSFERAVKMEVRNSSEPTPHFLKAYEHRLQGNVVPLICHTTIFTEAPRNTGWDNLRKTILEALAPNEAMALLVQASQVAKWATPTVSVVDGLHGYTATATLEFSDPGPLSLTTSTYTSIPVSGYTRKSASHLAHLALLYAICDFTFTFQLEEAREVSDPSKNPISILNQTAQVKKLPLPTFEYSDSGPSHQKVFVCTCLFLDKRIDATGATKQMAKTEAARKMLGVLPQSL